MLPMTLMTPDDVAAMIGRSRFTVLAMARRGELPTPIRLNARTLRWERSALLTAFGIDPAQHAPQATGEAAGGAPL